MSQCIVPNWNLRHERQEQVEGGESNRYSHVNNNNNNHNNNQQQQQQQQQHNLITNHDPFPMSNYEVAELTWQNGQLAMHGLGGLQLTAPTKPTWGRSNDTLESIVHQATCHKQGDQPLNLLQHHHKNTPPNLPSMVAPSASKWSESSSGRVQIVPGLLKKRTRADSDQCMHDDGADMSACASASATFCRDSDTTMVTWASYESPRSLKTKTLDEDSACHGGSENQDEDRETKAETGRSRSSRRSRAAAVHNQSERRRRDRINQKMKALQKLVPNASKTDKASMLDEVIEYLKQLQAQVQMMSVSRSMPQMMMPLGMQQHIQMSLLARMGMGVGLGMGMGMIDMNAAAAISRGPPPQSLPPLIHPPPASATTPTFVPSPFLMPSMIPTTCQPPPQPNSEPGDTSSSVPLPDPYCAFLAQSMNMELYNKMAALYRQQVNQATQATSSPSQSNLVQSD